MGLGLGLGLLLLKCWVRMTGVCLYGVTSVAGTPPKTDAGGRAMTIGGILFEDYHNNIIRSGQVRL